MKLIDHQLFFETIHHMSLFVSDADFVAWLIPIGELLIVGALLINKTKKIGLYCALVTMIIFTCYVWYFVHNPTHRPCSCGGIIQKMNWRQHLYFNIILTVLTFIAILIDNKVIGRRLSQKNSLKYNFT